MSGAVSAGLAALVVFGVLALALVLCLAERFRRDAHIRKMARAYRERTS